MADYRRKLEEYNQTVNGKPTIASNGNIKLVGTTGTPGSLGYYGNMSVVTTDSSNYALGQISWGANTSLIGTSKKASLLDYQGKIVDGNESDFYDITDVVHNNGTITLTNVVKDAYGISYDLKLGFTDTDPGTTAGHKSTVIIGPANDGSIEFDFYGGYETANAGLNISSMQFVYHGTNVAVPVFINSVFGDLDIRQSFDTNLGNALSWASSDSNVSISGNTYAAKDDSSSDGFKTAPKGTGVMIGTGSSFYYHFYNGSRYGFTPDVNVPGGSDSGTQFNLLGRGTSLAHTPTPPVRQFDPAPTRKTTSVHYHNDVTSQKAAISFHLL